MKEITTFTCEDCASSEGFETTCPYAEEIDGERVDVVLCEQCFVQRQQDI